MVQSIVAGMIRMSTQQSSETLFGYLMKGAASLAGAFGGSTPTGMDTNTDLLRRRSRWATSTRS